MSPELFTLGRWAAPLSIFALVGVMNAMNMTDGLDGLAGALALAACISFGAAASFAGQGPEFAVICITAGATLAFLVFNARLPWRTRRPRCSWATPAACCSASCSAGSRCASR